MNYTQIVVLCLNCYISIFDAIGSAVPVKKIFEGFLPCYGHGDHLGHVTWFIYNHIGSPFIQMLPIKFDVGWPSGFRGEDL